MSHHDDVDTRAIDLEAIRVRPKLPLLSPENREMLEDLVEGSTDAELARDYTGGDLHTLHKRLRTVLFRQLDFDPSVPVREAIASLAYAFALEHKTAL